MEGRRKNAVSPFGKPIKNKMKKINRERLLLFTLVAVAFFAFLMWSIQQHQKEIEASDVFINGAPELENGAIKITEPDFEATIASPLAVSGQADLTKGRLKVKISDSRGSVLAESYISTKDPKTMSSFSTKLNFKKSETKSGKVEFFIVGKNNAQTYLVTVPVFFK